MDVTAVYSWPSSHPDRNAETVEESLGVLALPLRTVSPPPRAHATGRSFAEAGASFHARSACTAVSPLAAKRRACFFLASTAFWSSETPCSTARCSSCSRASLLLIPLPSARATGPQAPAPDRRQLLLARVATMSGSGHQQYRELHASGSSLGSSVGGHGSFPLSASHFRSLPLSRRARGELLAEARQNARACLRLAFSGQWRYVPPEKDGAQMRKDTSNLAESRRLVRAAAVLRCQEHELRQVLTNTSSDSWRAFARQCCGKRLLDALVLHAVRSAPSSSSASRADRSRHDASDDDDAGRASLWQGGSNNHELDSGRAPVRLVDDDALSASGGSTPRRLPRRRSEAYNGRWTSGRRASNQDEAAAERDADPDGLGDGADELLTVKWGVFEAGAGRKRDLCVVDYQSLAFLPTDDDGDDDDGDDTAAEERERVHVWVLASTDGERVGCPPLRASHGVKRARLSRLGVFWRRSGEGETEVVVCGSFPSRHAPAATAALLAGLAKLQAIVEGLRVGSQRFLPRAAWVDDAARASCLLCLRHFFALRRKHHCRRCGEVVCADCSAVARVDRPGLGPAKLRMCKVCGLRARATPLRAADRENLFDRRAGGDALFAGGLSAGDLTDRASYSGSKRSDAGDDSGSSLGSSDSSPSRPCGNQSGDERADVAAVHPMPADAEQQQQQPDKGGDMFELLCELACQTLSCPIASVALVDARGQVVRSAAGLDGRPGLDRELGVFLERVMGQAPAVVLDAHADAQARRAFPLAPPAIRFFAGSPIHSRAGRKLGYVCVADTAGRAALGASCAFTMERLASLAVTTMERNAAAGNQAADDGDRPAARHTAAKCPGLASDVELVDAELLSGAKRGAEAAAAAAPTMEADVSVGDAQERMRRLLLKSYLTQQQLAAGTAPRGVAPL